MTSSSCICKEISYCLSCCFAAQDPTDVRLASFQAYDLMPFSNTQQLYLHVQMFVAMLFMVCLCKDSGMIYSK